MIPFLQSLIMLQIALAQTTTTTTCQNDPLVYKLDLREYLNQLGPDKQISDIDPEVLCDLVQSSDYVWLTQIWTPSNFNYQNFPNPSLANDYKITKNIKDYILDPNLGTAQDLIQLKQKLNQICHHTKFLGEFSFYIGKDSTLLQNKTRFLQIPYDKISVNYNQRYDNDGFIWAVDDTGRTIPYTAVWNLFRQTVITDIQDIIYRQILEQYKLDGIVFLQPSLGLYSFNIKYYQQEIQFFGQNGFLKDFYINFGLNNTIQTYFFMGGEDNINSGQILLNEGLQVLYSPLVNTYDRTWATTNFTFDPNGYQSQMTVLDKTLKYKGSKQIVVFAKQSLPQNQKSCFRVSFSGLSSTSIGLGIKSTITSKNYIVDTKKSNQGIFGIFDWMLLYQDDSTLDLKQWLSFIYYQGDTIEVQYDPLNKTVVFRKYQTNLKYQMQISALPSTLQYMVTIGFNGDYFIPFPFYFSNIYKSLSSDIIPNRNLNVSQTQSQLQFAQILPNLNLYNVSTLSFYIAKLPSNSIVGVGICNQDLVNRNNHQWTPTQQGSGAYMILSNGRTLNSERLLNDQQTDFIYGEGATIQVTFTPGQGLTMYDNKSLYRSVPVQRYVRNVNFCVAFKTINTQFFLIY